MWWFWGSIGIGFGFNRWVDYGRRGTETLVAGSIGGFSAGLSNRSLNESIKEWIGFEDGGERGFEALG